jgi:hypothetical protein
MIQELKYHAKMMKLTCFEDQTHDRQISKIETSKPKRIFYSNQSESNRISKYIIDQE